MGPHHTEHDELDDSSDPDYIDEEYDERSKGFKVDDILDFPEAKTFTMAEIHEKIHECQIDVNPPYQREVVWDEKRQVGLIDSLFRNFYIPPVLLCVRYDEDGEETRTCIDGKQRLTSIQRFMDGMIPYQQHRTKKKYWFVGINSKQRGRRLLPESMKEKFRSMVMTCVEYKDISPEMERDIFQRVQKGVPLGNAEKLQAISSAWVDWIIELTKRYEDFKDSIVWDTKKARDFDCFAKAVYLIFTGKRQPPTEPQIRKFLETQATPDQNFKREIIDVFDAFLLLTRSPELSRPFTEVGKKVAPVEFIYIAVLIAKMHNQPDCRPIDIADKILLLRTTVRDEHKDVRHNTRVVTTIWKFLDKDGSNE